MIERNNSITVENLSFAYEKGKNILEDISFQVEPGKWVVVIGDSGCGKTTLIHILCGIIPKLIDGHISGTVLISNIDLSKGRPKDLAKVIGLVMQDSDSQIVASTVEDELAFGLENFSVEPVEIRGRIDRIMDDLSISHLRQINPNHLSGGEKKLVAIGSVLTMDPEIIVLDEPYSHLDSQGQSRIRNLLTQLKGQGKTIITVDHNYLNYHGIEDLWLLIEDGKTKAFGPPREVEILL